MLFNSNTTIFANTNEGDEPEVTEQPELPENVNEEGTPVEGQPQVTPETTPDETVIPPETEQEDPAAQTPAAEGTEPTSEPTATPEATPEEKEAEGTDPENEKEEETASWNFVGVFYCAEDGTRFEEALPVTAETKPVSEYAKEFEGYTWTGSASINQNPISALSNNSYTISNEWGETKISCSEYFSVDEVIYVEFPYTLAQQKELAEEEIKYETHFEYEDNRVKVTADAAEQAELPEDAEIHADYLTPGSSEYLKAVALILRDTDTDPEKTTEFELYDIYFTSGENRIEPNDYVRVNLNFKQTITPNAENGEVSSTEVVHVDNENNAEVITDSDVVTSSEGIEEVTFTNNTFSLYGVKYTVDYTYDGYFYSMEGNSEILLSDLFKALSIDEDAALATSVTFTDDSLLSVIPVEGNWILRSNKPFGTNETLIVVMNDGDKYLIDVTDSVTSSDLQHFLTELTIKAPKTDDGSYVLVKDNSYNLHMSFGENTEYQFPDDDTDMTYQIPTDFKADDQAKKQIVISVKDGATMYEVKASYSITNNIITFNWDTNDPNFEHLKKAGNAEFDLSFNGTFQSDKEKIPFPGGKEIVIAKDLKPEVDVTKDASYDKATNKIKYKLTIPNTGYIKATDVVVSDNISGTALSFDEGSFKIYSNRDWTAKTPAISSTNKGFSYTIPSIDVNETVYIEYTASVNLSALDKGKGTVEQTGNSVSVQPDGGNEQTASKNFENQISYGSVSKSGEVSGDGDTKTVTWTVTVNEDANLPMGGHTITDTIKPDSTDIMSYSGDGITVQRYKKGETTPTSTTTYNWDDSSFVKTDSTWTWTVPTGDTEAYKYVITYTTTVDVSKAEKDVTVNNTANDDVGNSKDGSAVVPAGSKKIGLAKEVQSVTESETVWKTTLTVPKDGLDSAVIKDYLPNIWLDSVLKYDDFKPTEKGSYSVEGLKEGERVAVSEVIIENNVPYFTFTFYKKASGEATETEGLLPDTAERNIVLVYKTKTDSSWVSANPNDEHENKVQINTVTATAKTRIPSSGSITEKKTDGSGTVVIDGVRYPYIKFFISLTNASSESITIEDNFDTAKFKYFDIFNTTYSNPTGAGINTWGDEKLKDNNWQPATNPATVTETETGIKIQFTSANKQIPSTKDGIYYFNYFLIAKDEDTLNLLNQEASVANNYTLSFNNTAIYGNSEKSSTFDYKYQGLSKEILTADSDLKGKGVVNANFRITLNPAGATLNGGNPIKVIDTFSNLSIDYNTIRANPSEGVAWDFDGNTATFIIPDSTKVVITYTARVINTGDFENTAEMKTFKETIKKQAQVDTSGGGTASTLAINLMKYEAGDQNKRLSGAEFALLDANKNPIVYRKGTNSGKPVTFKTGTDGMINVFGDADKDGWWLEADKKYYLRETKAPDGYKLATFDYSFTIAKNGVADYDNYIYHDGDTMSAKNYPGTQVEVKKVWSDGAANHTTDTVTVQLFQKIGNADWNSNINLYDDKPSKEMILDLNSDNEWRGEFKSLPTKNDNGELIVYKVEETKINGVDIPSTSYNVETTSTSITDQNGLTHNYVFTVRNSFNETEYEVKGTKALKQNGTNISFDKDAFAFRLEKVSAVTLDGQTTIEDKNDDITVLNEKPNENKVADINFGKLHFSQTGIYTYRIYETTTSSNGITTDNLKRLLIVTVNESEGKLVASVAVKEDTVDKADSSLNFINNIQTGNLSISKSVISKAATGKFDFEVSFEYNGSPLTGRYTISIAGNDIQKTLVNGKTSISLAHGETAVIKDLPVGTKYTVRETTVIEGINATMSPEDGRGEIVSDSGSTANTVSVTNTDTRTGKLVVRKKIAGNAASSSDVFKFKVTLKNANGTVDTSINKTIGDVTFTEGVSAEFELKGGEEKTIEPLPYGTHYLVTETSSGTSYAVTSEGSEGVIDDSSSDDPSIATFTNTKNLYGALSVQKTVLPAGTDTEKVFHFTITISDKSFDGKVMVSDTERATFNNGSVSFNLKNGETALIKGLANGTSYKISEDDYGSEGYVTTTSNCEGTIEGNANTAETVTSPQAANVAKITNNKHEYGDLVISKALEGNATDPDKDFTFTVNLSGTYKDGSDQDTDVTKGNHTFDGTTFTNGETTIKLKGGETKTIKQIPAGLHYSIDESDKDGYIVVSKLNGEIKESISNETIKPNTGESAGFNNVSFTNTKNSYGGIKLSKAVAGNDPDEKTWFAFKVTLSDKSVSGTFGDVTFLNGVSVTPEVDAEKGIPSGFFTITKEKGVAITGLPAGITYTIEEDDYSTTYDSREFTWGDSQSSSNNATGTIVAVSAADNKPSKVSSDSIPSINTVLCTNTRNRYGKLRIEKVVEGTNADSNQEFPIKITLANSNMALIKGRTFSEVTFDENGVAYIKLKAGKSKTLKDLPLGTTFTVEEVKSHSFGDNDNVTIPNGYKLKDYTLKYESVTEKGKNTGTIDIKQRTVSITNTFKAQGYVDLRAEKTVNGKTPASSETFNFSIRSVDENLSAVSGVSQIIQNKNNKVVFNRINYSNGDLGKTFYYLISETSEDRNGLTSDRSEYLVKVVVPNYDGIDVNQNVTPTVTYTKIKDRSGALLDSRVVLEDGRVPQFDNQYTATGKASFKGTKTFTGKDMSDGQFKFTITDYAGKKIADGVSQAAEDGKTSAIKWTYVDGKDGIDFTLEDQGKKFVYTITEEAVTEAGVVAEISSYDVSITVSDLGNGKLNTPVVYEDSNGVTHEAADFLNNYKEGNLKVSKTVRGNAGDTAKEFNFTVTLDDKSITGTYGEMEFKDGVATFKLKSGESKIAEKLPQEIGYKVVEKEANADGYTTGTEGAEGKIKGDKTVEAKFTNTKNEEEKPNYTSVDIKAKKVWDDNNNANGKRPSKVRVHLLANGVDTGYVAELSEANNWFYTWYALPLNNEDGNFVTYDVVEEGVDGYTSSVSGDMYGGYTITNTNKKKSPKTDDTFHVFGWAVSLITSMIASMIAALLLRRKK